MIRGLSGPSLDNSDISSGQVDLRVVERGLGLVLVGASEAVQVSLVDQLVNLLHVLTSHLQLHTSLPSPLHRLWLQSARINVLG